MNIATVVLYVWAFGQVPPASTVTVHLRIELDAGLPPAVISNGIRELAAIWKPAGVAVTHGDRSQPAPPGAAMVALRLLNTPVRRDERGEVILGWVLRDESGVLAPTLNFSVPGARELLLPMTHSGRPLFERPQGVIDRVLATMIGRVAAHELGHYLTQDRHHSKDGLMRPQYSTIDLIGPSRRPFLARAEEFRAIREAVTKLADSQARR